MWLKMVTSLISCLTSKGRSPRAARKGKPRGLLARLLLSAICIGQFGAAQAAWTMIGRTDVFRVYLDDKQVNRNGDFAQVSQLTDYTVAQWVDARTAVGSIKQLIEFDCKQHTFRFLSAIAFSEQMEAGSLVASETLADPQWLPIEPDSTVEKIEKFACGKG